MTISFDDHDTLVDEIFLARGYKPTDAAAFVRIAKEAAFNGVHSHNAAKLIHLEARFGSLTNKSARIEEHRTSACSEWWDANNGPGPAVAYRALDRAIALAKKHGTGIISIDQATHYLYGGGYVLEAARRGYVAFTTCTSTLAEVLPHLGSRPSIGTNPLSFALPTQSAIGFPILADFATSAISMGTVESRRRIGLSLPARSAVDRNNFETLDPASVAALLPAAAHKGWCLGFLIEALGAYIGGSLPSRRGHPDTAKPSTSFFFMVMRPDVLTNSNDPTDNLQAVVADILSGNRAVLLPGQREHEHRQECLAVSGLIIPDADLAAIRSEALAAK